jgi:hypothetical protein
MQHSQLCFDFRLWQPPQQKMNENETQRDNEKEN